eukprot:g7830.t1
MRFGVSGSSVTTRSRQFGLTVRAENCLIANTKSGGHAFIGIHLARKLMTQGHTVTLMNAGDQASLASKDPFSQYDLISSAGGQVVWADPKDPTTYPSGSFDVVYDNNGKTLEECKPMIDTFKDKVSHYVFVSSAGAYNANEIEPMHLEGDPRKSSAGHYAVEEYLKKENLPYSIFHPLYIYGPYTAKDCEQWFIDRIIRGRPVPIPGPGIQMTSISHVEDIASMLATVPGKKEAVKQEFNICSDRCISFEGICKLVGEALGKRVKIVYYDPKALGLKKGEGFPFRTVHFFASSSKAKLVLGWKPSHVFQSDVKELCEAYVASGRDKKDIDFSTDDKVLAAVA